MDIRKLDSLIKLLDDDSQVVRDAVHKELALQGSSLKEKLAQLPEPVTSGQRRLLHDLLEGARREVLRAVWPQWFHLKDDKQKLEEAFHHLAIFQSGFLYYSNLKWLLDRLAAEYRATHRRTDPYKLSNFLFKIKGLKGAESDYYNPQNSNLAYVIEKKRGLPISLSVIYILVGARLGLQIEGCNFPGHFMARVRSGKKLMLVDCYNEGQFLDEGTLISSETPKGVQDIVHMKTDAETIVARVLNNLALAYRKENAKESEELITELLKGLEKRIGPRIFSETYFEDIFEEKEPLYRSGFLVRHKRYGYRGLVVDFDLTCQADDDWYFSNRTQPDRDQPWYHVLVHQSDQVTYAAQDSLVPDESLQEIDHPLVPYFFTKSKNGLYLRNNNPWPR